MKIITKKLSIFVLLIFLNLTLSSQSPAKYWVQFTDKHNSQFSIQQPEKFLSPQAIEKRNFFQIPITVEDLPVNNQYINKILEIDSGIVLFTKSKWLNAITVYSEDSTFMEKVLAFPFVRDCERTIYMQETENIIDKDSIFVFQTNRGEVSIFSLPANLKYGETREQIRLNNAHWLHRLGYHGEGIELMVMDAGFHNVDTLQFFNDLRNENRLLGVRNFVDFAENPFKKVNHGTMVLSCIVSYKPDIFVGSAPKVSIYLAKTEDDRTENKIEEDNWVAGIEWADSLGVDIVNSSLGYKEFDDTTVTRTYEDLTGKVSRASIAADIATRKGLIVCNSAGNEGNTEWHYIGSPADAHNIISVGATNNQGVIAKFSSYGPTADGRIKPDACATGWNTMVVHPRGRVIPSNGTSFASPILAGMVACLRQAFPEKTNFQIIEAIRLSGNHANAPTNHLGYGITDFLKAYNHLKFNNLIIDKSKHRFVPEVSEYVLHDDFLILKINSKSEQQLEIIANYKLSKKSYKKRFKLQIGENQLKLKIKKIKSTYDFLSIKIIGEFDLFEYLFGIEKNNEL